MITPLGTVLYSPRSGLLPESVGESAIFRRSRCSPNCVTSIAKDVLTLELQR